MAKPHWPSTLRARLTLGYTTLLGIPLVALALGFYLLFARTLQNRTDEFIGDALTAFSRELSAERRAALTPAEAMRATSNEVRFQDIRIAILDSTGSVVAASRADADEKAEGPPATMLSDLAVRAMRARDTSTLGALRVAGTDGEYLVGVRPVVMDGERFAITGTYSLGDIERILARIRGILIVVIPLLLMLAASGGYFLATRSLVPLAEMGSRAAMISAANIGDRLPVAGGDELAGLARVFNGLLDRLEASFAQQRRFMADASHELRTPTAILRAEADVTLAREHRPEEEYRASFAVIQDSSRRLTRVVDDLFLLARADAGNLVERRDRVYLEEILHDATIGVRSLADRRAIQVDIGHVVEAPFRGDADLLGRLFLNLLDNAIKYSPDDTVVRVEMSAKDGWYEVDVIDHGRGIPVDAQSRVFERFFRVDTARARDEATVTSGAGLGLSIARGICEMHGGSLELIESKPGRTVFRVRLPSGSGP